NLDKLKIKELNNLQTQAADLISNNDNLVILAPTGSGKTIAFLLPLLKSVDLHNTKYTQSLILVPTRELALQIENVLRQLQTGFKITCCYGGHKREIEENNLIEPPAILIATPGRLNDHLRRKNADISKISFLVIDEFDKMLELGFREELETITNQIPASNLKRILTSATSDEIPEFLNMHDVRTLNLLSEENKDKISIRIIASDQKDKLESLFELLCFTGNTSSIVFCNHRESVERISNFLRDKSLMNVFYHGGMEQRDREVALCKFRNGSSDILITTDLASRGLDISNIRNIIHYHIPQDEATFTHRNGRTARMHNTGIVYLILSEDEKVPDYIENAEDFKLPQTLSIPEKPKWITLFIDAGKKDKINKIDIVGFLSNKANLKKDDIGLIEVKDYFSFAAIRKSKATHALEAVKNEKMKNKKIRISAAK
ncbi:MAG: DEAD/DEAH box helicase, partial [Bacteroidetes bacterium]|nr:DEAD/DEAH box helicase [Bacteroidota bacterium]